MSKKFIFQIKKIFLPSFLLIYLIINVIFNSNPILNPDSNGYIDLAKRIANFNIHGYSGERTPVYPFVLAILNDYDYVVYFQIFLVVATLFLTYKIIEIFTKSQLMSFIGILFYSLNPTVLIYIRSIQTEVITTFLVVLSILFFALFNFYDRYKYILLSILFAGLAGLCRPIFSLLPIAILLFLIIIHKPAKQNKFLTVLLSSLLVVAIYSPWLAVNYFNTGRLTLTTLSGFNLTNPVSNCITLQNDEYFKERLVYTRERQKQIVSTGSSVHTIWKVIPKLLNENTYPELSSKFAKISLKSIAQNPLCYLKNVSNAFIKFWNSLDDRDLTALNKIIPNLSRFFHLLINILFLFLTFFFIVMTKRIKIYLDKTMILIWLFILSIAFGQALIEYGENFRYSFPVIPLVMIFTISSLFLIYNKKKENMIANQNKSQLSDKYCNKL